MLIKSSRLNNKEDRGRMDEDIERDRGWAMDFKDKS